MKTGHLTTCNGATVEFAQLGPDTFHLQSRVPINPVGSRKDWSFVLRRMEQKRPIRLAQIGMIFCPFGDGNGLFEFRNPLFVGTCQEGFMLFLTDVPAFATMVKDVLSPAA